MEQRSKTLQCGSKCAKQLSCTYYIIKTFLLNDKLFHSIYLIQANKQGGFMLENDFSHNKVFKSDSDGTELHLFSILNWQFMPIWKIFTKTNHSCTDLN